MPFSKVGYFKKLQKNYFIDFLPMFSHFQLFQKINNNLMLKNIFTNCNPVQSWGVQHKTLNTFKTLSELNLCVALIRLLKMIH